MRLLELALLAFGPFNGQRLDFSKRGALHVIYGPNEAGKSTALRAITNLLYGIPVNTQDAHRHSMPDLRIGGRLTGSNGTSLEIVRRKGSKNTLLDTNGSPLGDNALLPLLAGVNEAVFRSMFGLDYVTLRDGAEALLHGKGAVGESLFAAALGGASLHALLKQLEDQTAAIYKKSGQKPVLNEAIKAYLAADKRSRESARSADAYRTQQDALARAREENVGLVAQRRALATELSRLQRALRVLPLLTRRLHLRSQRDALGDVPRLAEDAASQRTRAQADHAEALREQARLAAELMELRARRAALSEPESVLAIEASVIEELQNALGSVRSAAGDLPRRRGELHALEEQAAAILCDLGQSESLDRIDELRVSAAAQARIRVLAQERSGIVANRDNALQAHVALAARSAAQRAQLEALPAATDLFPLEQALQRARRLGDVDESIAEARRALDDLGEEVRMRLAALPLWSRDARLLRAARLPTSDSVELYRQRFAQAEASRSELATQRRNVDQKIVEVKREIDALRLAGAVPSEAELDGQRLRRDELWRQLRTAETSRVDRLAAEFESAVEKADALADRLRREAGRVATLARLTADSDACAHERERVERDETAQAAGEAALRREWMSLWAEAEIPPLDPSVMAGWLGRVAEINELHARWERDSKQTAQLVERRARRRSQLVDAIAALTAESVPGGDELGSVIEVAEGIVQRLAQAQTRRQILADGVATIEADRIEVERQVQHYERLWAGWQESWEASVRSLRLPLTATPEEALAVLDELGRLFAKAAEMDKLRQRIHGMEGDAQRLAEQVGGLARQHAPELVSLPPLECGDKIVRSYRAALDEQQQRTRIDAEIRTKEQRIGVCAEAVHVAATSLAGLMERAAVQCLEDLEPVERAAGEVFRLNAALADVERELSAAGEGASIEEMVEQTRGLDPDGVRARIAECEEEMEALVESQRVLHQRIGSYEAGVEHQENAQGAADDAADAQEHLAAIKSHVRKYLRLRLAAIVIRREIERYREQNQGPLIARASALFPRLTLGHYTGVRVGFDASDEPVLLCVNTAGEEKTVQDLSDGARDQLYLALRVATLEHHAETNPLMPVVLDDVLVHFDDERTRAALSVLGDLAAHTQVLLFTHHARVVELARAALPEEKRVEHVLSREVADSQRVAG